MRITLRALLPLYLAIALFVLLIPFQIVSAESSAMDDEQAQAANLGFCEMSLSQEPISGSAFMKMLDRLVELADSAKRDEWAAELTDFRFSEVPLSRSNAFIMLYWAAETLGGEFMQMNSDWTVYNNKIGEACWDTYIPDVDMFGKTLYEPSPLDGSGWQRDAAAYFYSFGRVSLLNGKPLFDYDEKSNSMRSNEVLTVEEAALAVCRLYDSNPDKMAEIQAQQNAAATPPLKPSAKEVEEIEAAYMLGIIPEAWQADYDTFVTGQEFAQTVLSSINLKNSTVKPATEKRAGAMSGYYITREAAAAFLYRAVLENFFGFDDASEPWGGEFGDCFTYAVTLSKYHDRVGGAMPCMEFVLSNQGKLEMDVWAVGFVALQIDQYSMQTLFDVTEDGYVRIHDTMRRWEAACAAYRLYNAYLTGETMPAADVEPIALSESEREQALAMPSASYDHLPYFAGTALDNKSFANGAHHTGNMYQDEDFEILHELGFNYTRLMINKDLLFQFGDSLLVNMDHLKNLDDAVRWAIKYNVHITICLPDMPGFAGATMETAGFYDDALLNTACQAYAMLARRYQGVPSSVLSFNPFNEPWRMAEDEDAYVRGVRAVIQAIREEAPDRLIFVDCIPAKGPINALAEDKVAQAFHWYDPDPFVTGGTVGNTPWYQAQIWPLPYANGWLNKKGARLDMTGDFPEGTQIELLLGTETKQGKVTLLAGTKKIQTLSVPKSDGTNGIHLTFDPIKTTASNLTIQNTGGKTVQIASIAVVFPEENPVGTPVYESIWAQNWISVDYRSMTVIYCLPYPDFRQKDGGKYSTIEILSDGSYTNTEQSEWLFDDKAIKNELERWLIFREKTGVEFMVQEMGVMSSTAQKAALAWLDELTEQLSLNNVGWNLWSDVWQYLNNNRYGAKLEAFHGYTLEREMVDVLQKHMQPAFDSEEK